MQIVRGYGWPTCTWGWSCRSRSTPWRWSCSASSSARSRPSCFDSARVDGASELQILTRIAVPLARPATLAGATVLALPVVVLFVVFQRRFTSTDLGSGVKG